MSVYVMMDCLRVQRSAGNIRNTKRDLWKNLHDFSNLRIIAKIMQDISKFLSDHRAANKTWLV
jgi:hypothetical protein